MKQPPRISLDAMGGDHAPEIIVQGADRAFAAYPDISLIFVGDERKITLLKKKLVHEEAEIHHTDEAVAQKLSPLRLCAPERILPCGGPLSLLQMVRLTRWFLQEIQVL